MNIGLLLRTVAHLKPTQVFYQLKYRLVKPKLRSYKCGELAKMTILPAIDRYRCCDGDRFTFLNLTAKFRDWNYGDNGPLWAYNLNYMDWLNQPGMTTAEGARWIDRFIADLSGNRIGLDPYPTALRGINWIKFIVGHNNELADDLVQRWNASLYSQYRLLAKKLEYHLLANHLLEDVYSLYVAALYFGDRRLYRKAARLLKRELDRQILPDGAHFEQSPMYHCILLDRLLDCYNFSLCNRRFDGQDAMTDCLAEKARLMLGHLESVAYADGSIPLLNDAAYGIAPTPEQLRDYARRLGLTWATIPMRECGYRKLHRGAMEAIADVGNIAASYQPGHTHADSLSYELRIGGEPFIVDSGISTYNKNARRQLERSTAAHNTVSLDGRNSSEVWGGFRVGGRAKVNLLTDSGDTVAAEHDGFGRAKTHRRSFHIVNGALEIADTLSAPCEAVSYIHFAPTVSVRSCSSTEIATNHADILIENASRVEIADGTVATEYNRLQPTKIASIIFNTTMKYRIVEKAQDVLAKGITAITPPIND